MRFHARLELEIEEEWKPGGEMQNFVLASLNFVYV
jgi:hypothetical protein